MVKKSILAKVGDKINYKLIRDGYKTGKGNVVVTAEMDTKTTIVADVPSTAYTSNLDYEVDISGENPPIINIKNDITCPDDTVISKGKYFYYNLLGSEDYYKFSKEKADKIGIFNDNDPKYYDINSNLSFTNLSHQNGIISGFSRSNYASFNVSSYEVGGGFVIYFRTGSDNAQQGQIFYTGLETGLLIDTTFTCGRFGFTPTIVAQPNTNYYCKMTYQSSGEGLYQIYDENGDLLCTGNGIDTSSSYSISLGSLYQYYSQAFKGSIDLIKSYIFKADGTKTYFCDFGYNVPGIKDFKLNDNGAELTTKLFDYHYKEEIPYKVNLTKIGNISINSDGTVSNFSTSNYLRMLDKPSSSTTNFEMLFHFKCTSFSNNEILMGDSGNVWNNVLIYVYNNRFQIGNNRYWYTGTHEILLNKEYWGKVIFNNGTLSSYISEDGITYEQDYTGSLSSYVWNNNADIGYSVADNQAFRGTIWLEDCYVQYGNEEKKYFAEKPQLNDKTSLYINTEKDNDLYYKKDELQLNVSKVGTAAVDENGIASNFGNNSYVTFGKLNAGDNPWEMVFKVKYKEHSGFQRFCGPSDNAINLLITVSDDDKLRLWISTNGSDWSISGKNSKTTLVNNTTYYIKALFNGTNYILSLSTDGINYNEEINEASTTPMYNGVSTDFQIGCAFSGESQYNWQGTIDLKESYIKIGTNEKKYFAKNIKKRYDIPSLYSEFIDSITIPAHALYDYVNGEWKLSGDSPVITQDVTVNADNAEIAMKEIIE